MEITTLIETGGASYPWSEEQAAAQVLAALGGDPTNDTSSARILPVTVRITTNVTLGDGDRLLYTADEAATQVLAALGGNPTTDECDVGVTMPTTVGSAGVER